MTVTASPLIIPLWADLLAIAVGGVQGAMFAAQFRDRRLDLLGVALIGVAAGTGGGLFRDVLLNQVPVTLRSNWYILVAVGAALLGMLLERLFQRLGKVITAIDAILRDLLLNLPIALMHVGSLYAIAAVAGAGTLVVLVALGVPVFIAAVVCVAVTFGVRVLAVLFKWSLPEQRRLERMPRWRRRSVRR